MILILTVPSDSHANHLVQHLQQRGSAFVRFDPAAFPVQATLTLRQDLAGRSPGTIRLADGLIDLGAVRTIWLRRPGRPEVHPSLTDPWTREALAGECSDVL